MKIITRILIVAVVIVAGLCWVLPVGLCLYLTKTAPAIARMVPTDLKDLPISEAPETKLSYFGREFEVPWSALDNSETKVLASKPDHQTAWICFRSGLKLFVVVTPREKTGFNYAFMKRVYETTPDTLHPWTLSASVRYQEQILLRLKSSFLQGIALGHPSNPAESGIFNLQGQGYRGFQCGNPQIWQPVLELRLYDDDGNVQIKILRKGYDDPAGVTQPEINRIVQSLHKIEPASPIAGR